MSGSPCTGPGGRWEWRGTTLGSTWLPNRRGARSKLVQSNIEGAIFNAGTLETRKQWLYLVTKSGEACRWPLVFGPELVGPQVRANRGHGRTQGPCLNLPLAWTSHAKSKHFTVTFNRRSAPGDSQGPFAFLTSPCRTVRGCPNAGWSPIGGGSHTQSAVGGNAHLSARFPVSLWRVHGEGM